MPNYYFKEIWTPLKLVHIKFFKDDENLYWIKVGHHSRRPLRGILKKVE